MKAILAALAVIAGAVPVAAQADCGIKGSGDVNILSNVYPALQAIKTVVEGCSAGPLHVTMKLTKGNVAEIAQAFAASSSPFSAAQVANGSITAPQAAGQLRPLDDLVAKYKQQAQLEDGMLIRFGDHVMAIGFQVNAQYLYYRTDLFQKYGLDVPKTYDQLFAALDKIKAEPGMEHPLTGAYQTGWEIGEEFTNLFLAEGGEFFKPGSTQPNLVSKEGIATLELMKRLMSYMSPNALSIDSALAEQQIEQAHAAAGVIWADSAPSMDDPKASSVVGKVGFAAAPAVKAGGPAASTVWWDGFVIPKNAQADADTTFQVIAAALSPQVVAAHNDLAIWLRSNYKPTKYAAGVLETVQSGAPPYPSTPQQSLIHGAIGDHVGDYLAGKTSAEGALRAAEDAYRRAAKDKGLL